MKESGGPAPARVKSSLIANSHWNLVAFACGLAANFITVPFVVGWTSLETFGQAGLVLAVCAPLMLVGTVLGQALVREMSAHVSAGQDESALKNLDAALRLCVLSSALGWIALVLAGPWITMTLIRSDLSYPTLVVAFQIAATGWFAQQLSLVLQGACIARQDFRTIAKVAAFSAVAGIAATLGSTWAIPRLEGYLVGLAAGLILSLLAWMLASRRDVRWRAVLHAPRRTEMAALLHFSKWQSVAQLAGAFGNQIDRYVLGSLAPIAIIGQYNVANRLQEAAYIGVVKAGEVLFPRFGSLASNSEQDRSRFFQVSSWVVGTFSAAVLAPLAVLAAAVLTLWVGPEAASGGARLLSTLVLGGIVGCGSNVFVYYAMGTGRNAPVALISVLYSVMTVVFTVLVIQGFGPLAAGAGLLAASVVRVAASFIVTRRSFFPELGWGELSVSTLLPVIAGVGVALGAQTIDFGPIHGWVHLILLYGVLSAAVLLLTMAASALFGSGRNIIVRAGSALSGKGFA